VPRFSVSLVLGFRVRVSVRSVYCTFGLSHLPTIEPSDYRYTIDSSTVIKVNSKICIQCFDTVGHQEGHSAWTKLG